MLPSHKPWSTGQKIAFRFFCCFFLVYTFPFPLNAIPFTDELTSLNAHLTAWYNAILDAYTNMWHAFIPWVGSRVLRLKTPITIFTNGSGDTTYDYVQLFTFVWLSLLATVVWTIIDRKRKSYAIAYYWLRVLVRYNLAYFLLIYGLIKIFHLQMPFPYLSTLVQPFGDKSPMGLAWSFVGYSKAFSAFTGWGETIAGILLFFRRTTTLGALLSAVVMGNIVVINFCYDVPVKLFSSVLWVMSVFLIMPDLKRLLRVFVQNRATEPADLGFPLRRKWQRVTRLVLKVLFIGYAFYGNISGDIKSLKEYGDARVLPPLYGIYNLVSYVHNRDTVPLLATDITKWKQLAIDFSQYALIRRMDDTARGYNLTVDTVKKNLVLFPYNDTLNKSVFLYQVDSPYLSLDGKVRDDSVHMRFRRWNERSFRLVSRGFHWINEYPYNR